VKHINRVEIISSTGIPFDLQIYLLCRGRDAHFFHGSFDGFGILHSKLLENILNILCLANEGAFLELLDLKSKEILQLPHHGHLKFLYHNSTKLLTRLLVSIPKDNIININLAYKQVFVNCFSEESRVGFSDFKTISEKKVF
jgi:hypothetical protein